jgi:hypothetical protein
MGTATTCILYQCGTPITGRRGTWVRIHPAIEGKLTRGFEGADVGERLQVRLIHTDVERGFIDFARER